MINKVIICLAVLPAFLFAQSAFDRDKLFEEFMGFKTGKPVNEQIAVKCNFGIVNSVIVNWDKFTEAQKSLMKPMLERPILQTSIISPSGFFRIHYNNTGTDAVQYDIQEFARAADSAYSFEIGYLGFLPPPPDNGEGGDDRYDIYVMETGNLYGGTEFTLGTNGKGSSYMKVHYSFAGGFYTHGIDAARVTVAHEFHHAIQIGGYIFREEDTWFYELTSTAMEEFVFNTVDDYHAYLNSYFSKPETPLDGGGIRQLAGYDVAIWNLFLQEKFGFDIFRRQWELMPQMRAMLAISQSISERSAVFTTVYNEFGIWSYFTGKRAVPGKYFKEAAEYPILSISISNNKTFVPPNIVYSVLSYPASNNFLRVVYPSFNDIDSLIAIVTNGDVNAQISNPNTQFLFTYNVDTATNAGWKKIQKNLTETLFYIFLDASNPFIWANSEILNNKLIDGNNVFVKDEDFVFPSPFRYSKNYNNGNFINIPVETNISGQVSIAIFTASMDLVYSADANIDKSLGPPLIRWNGRSNSNQKLASGVYVYVTKSGDTVTKGKIVIFND